MTYNLTRKRAITLAVVLSLGFGAVTFLSGRRARRAATTPTVQTPPHK